MNKVGGIMFSLRDLIVFLAGAQFFHTISHMLIPYFFKLPLKYKLGFLTKKLNLFAIIANAIITLLLLWWAFSLK